MVEAIIEAAAAILLDPLTFALKINYLSIGWELEAKLGVCCARRGELSNAPWT